MGLPRQKDAEPPPAFSMTLSRGLTNAAFVEYLEADERTNGAARCVWGTVDGFLGNRVPTRPPAAAGRLTLNT